jgi:hypothetical protein
MEKFGIINLKILIALPIEIGNIAGAISKSEDKSWKRFLKLFDLFDEAVDLLKVDWKLIKDEYLDLSEVEKSEIQQYLIERFDLPNDRIESIVENSFSILFELETVIKKTIALVQAFRSSDPLPS